MSQNVSTRILIQHLLILNNRLCFRLHKTVSITTSTPPKQITKSSTSSVNKKHDQQIPALFKNLEKVGHRTSDLFPSW